MILHDLRISQRNKTATREQALAKSVPVLVADISLKQPLLRVAVRY
jgi:hypothetical protein